MLRLKQILADGGIQVAEAATVAGISRPAMSKIVNNDTWPKTGNAAAIKSAIHDFLIQRGLVAEGCFELEPARCNALAPVSHDEVTDEGVEMLIRKQTLSQLAREHFKLRRDPFAMEVANQEDVFLTPAMRERLEDIESALLNGRFIALAGESGSGKTTLRELAEERLMSQKIRIIKPFVLGMEDNDKAGKTMRVAHIEEAIIHGIDPTARIKRSPQARGQQTQESLANAMAPCVLVFEEAHALSIPVLKHLKRLRELKTGLNRLGILLIGQSELANKLSEHKPEIREVVQRCELVHLEPLGKHLGDYITHRFSRAGITQADQVFEPDAIDAIGQKLTVSTKQPMRSAAGASVVTSATSLVYPLAVGNVAVAAMNLAADLGFPKVTADVVWRA